MNLSGEFGCLLGALGGGSSADSGTQVDSPDRLLDTL